MLRAHMGDVIQIRGKTEQRVTGVVNVLRAATEPLTYDSLIEKTGTPYDVLLYVLTTLIEVGLVEREDVALKPGRPKVYFKWVKVPQARAMGVR